MDAKKHARRAPPEFRPPVKAFIDRAADVIAVPASAAPSDDDAPDAPPTIAQTVRVNRHLYRLLEARAKEQHRSIAWVVRDILWRHFHGG